MQKGNVNGVLDLITNKPAVVTEWTILESPLLKIYPTAYAEMSIVYGCSNVAKLFEK